MKHHTKTKGDIGLVKIIADLTFKGLDCLLPIAEHLPFDLIAYDQETGNLYKIQCKFRNKRKGGLDISVRTSYLGGQGSVSKRYADGSFDVLAIYSPDTDAVYYIEERELEGKTTSIKLRIDAPNPEFCKEHNCNMAKDYLNFPFK